MEFENIRQALEYLYELSQLDEITIKTYEKQDCKDLIEERHATVKDMQDIMFEVAVNIADLLGLEETYLDEEASR